jgi:hypothetical protein
MKSLWIIGFFFSSLSIAYEVPPDVLEKYKHLESVEVTEQPDGSFAFGDARHFVRKGVHVLFLVGDRYTMAYQHGKLLREEIRNGALPEAARMLRNAVLNNLGNIPFLSEIVINNFYKNITDKMFESGIKQAIATGEKAPIMDGYGLSVATGIALDDVIHGALGPESLMVLLGQNLDRRGVLPNFSPMSCSSYMARGPATQDRNFLLAHNIDYPLNGFYDRYPTVFYFNPTDGTQKYWAVTSAGLHNAGVVGMNESGLVFFNHTVPTKEVSAEGLPVFQLAQEILRNAKTMDEALATFAKFRSAAGWNYLLVSTKEGKAVTLELSHKRQGVIPVTANVWSQTNHYRSDAMKDGEAHVNISVDNDTRARAMRMEQMVKAHPNGIGVREAIAVLGDKFDPINQEVRGLMNTVGVHVTMSSLVIQPSTRKVYVANGRAPVSQNEFVELPMVGYFDVQKFATESFQTFPNGSFKEKYTKLAAAEQLFIEAKIAFESELNYKKSLSLLEKVVALDQGSPGYFFNLGVMALYASNYARALEVFKALGSSKDKHYSLLGNYYTGRVLAHNEDKESALPYFEKVREQSDDREHKLKQAALTAIDRCKSHRKFPVRRRELSLMMQQADMIRY